jgi:uncharacterized membrane protein YeaQ/YmgE (transglycosylase-associated protein family)
MPRFLQFFNLRYHPRVVYLFWQIVVGILAGFLAGKIMRGRGYGLVIDLLLGIVGSILGGFVFGILGIYAASLIGRLVVATAGAVPLIYVARRVA